MPSKILIVSAAFYPENSPRSFRATELAREFARQGHEVSVMTTDRGATLEEFCVKHNIKLKCVPALQFKEIPVLAGFKGYLLRLIRRLLLMFFEYPEVELFWKIRKGLQYERAYDLLISVAVPYPVHWAVASVQQKQHRITRCWVADCGDPYMGNESDSFKRLFYFGWIEKWMFSRVDCITIPIESARVAYYKEFRPKISVIPQGVNFAELRADCRPYYKNSIPTFAYAGTFIPGYRDPRKLLEYLISLPNDFLFYIYTSMPSWLQEVEEKSRGRIISKSYLPRNDLIGQLSQMDFLVNIENSTSTQVPSKLIDYFLVERPVLSLSGNMISEDTIKQFLNGNYSEQLQFDNYEKFKIQNVSRQFLSLVDNHEDLENK